MGRESVGLDPEQILATVDRLSKRINERFPDSGLGVICQHLQAVAQRAGGKARWIAKPLYFLRIGSGIFVALLIMGFLGTLVRFYQPEREINFFQFLQGSEAGLNMFVLMGAAAFFLGTLEKRIKRSRVMTAIHELRVMAHLIDMHQLTKDPEIVQNPSQMTKSSPQRVLTAFQMARYLDYCSEMLSLVGKIAALYIQDFNDTDSLAAVGEIEDLTNDLSGKLWQKIALLHSPHHVLSSPK